VCVCVCVCVCVGGGVFSGCNSMYQSPPLAALGPSCVGCVELIFFSFTDWLFVLFLWPFSTMSMCSGRAVGFLGVIRSRWLRGRACSLPLWEATAL